MKLLLSLLLYICYLNLIVFGQGIQILEIEGYKNIYSAVPDYSNGESCSIEDIRFLIIDTDNTVLGITSVDTIPLALIQNIVLKKDGSSSVYKFWSNSVIPLGLTTFTITVTTQSGQNSIDFDFNCNTPNFTNARIRLSYSPELRMTPGVPNFCAPFYIIGIDFNIKYLFFRFNTVELQIIGQDNSFCYEIPRDLVENPSTLYDFEIVLGVNVYTVSYISALSSKSNVISNVESYPPTSIIFTESGMGLTSILKYTSNTNTNSPYQYSFVNQSATFISQVYPLYGSKGNLTYIVPLDDVNIIDQQLNNFYLAHLINGKRIDEKIEKTIKIFGYQTIQGVLMYSVHDIHEIPIFEAGFNQSDYNFNLYDLSFGNDLKLKTSAPYGFWAGGFGLELQYKISPLRSIGSSNAFNDFCVAIYPTFTWCLQIPPIKSSMDISPPIVESYEFIHLIDSIYRLILRVSDASGVASIKSDSFITSTNIYDSLSSGDILNGTYEYIVDVNRYIELIYSDVYENYEVIKPNSYISLNPVLYYKLPDIVLKSFTFTTIKSVTFEKNNLNLLVNGDSYNTIHLVLNNVSDDKVLQLELTDPISFDIESKVSKSWWPINYDSKTGRFSGKFVLPKNTIFGNIPYNIHVTPTQVITSEELYGLTGASQLNVVNSYLDNEGPLFYSITKIYEGSGWWNNAPTIIEAITMIGWSLNIEDNVGFDFGYIKVMGSFDNSIYHFNFTNSNLTSNGNIEILIKNTVPCITQEYVIVYVRLVDVNNVESIYEMFTNSPKPSRNPFRKFIDEPSCLRVSFECPLDTDMDPPELVIFNSDPSMINVFSAMRTITFNMEVSAFSSGIKINQLPIIYIQGSKMDTVECVTKIDYYKDDNKTIGYVCSIELPFGFGSPSNLGYSVYGLINNYGMYRGYTTMDLLNKFSTTAYMVTNNNYDFGESPHIVSHHPITSEGGRLVLFGFSLEKVDPIIEIKFLDDPTAASKEFLVTIINPTSIIIDSIPKTGRSPYIVTIFSLANEIQKDYVVHPIYFNSTFIFPPTTTQPPETSSPSPSPPITIAPTKCIGNPECGGKSNGYCNEGRSCICYSPWVGIDCLSQVIIVPKPNTNNSNPSTEIPIIDDNFEESTSNYLFKSLISIVSLRELNFNGKEIIKTITFDKWMFTELNDKKNQYFTNLTIQDSNGNDFITNVTVELEWFYEKTVIEFANSNLTMNPSTIKYTIDITEYPFQSGLNQLQLIISAQFESSQSNVCSLNEFGELSNDGDNYLKIQIEDHSLYGRFIKRAIIDSKISTVSNVFLDSTYNQITDKSESKLNSFIGITIPNYHRSIKIDPDFSVLLDSVPASDNDNSICTDTSSTKLTSSQLAGIIIGVIAFTAVVVTAITYHIFKKKQQIKFKNNIENKLKELK